MTPRALAARLSIWTVFDLDLFGDGRIAAQTTPYFCYDDRMRLAAQGGRAAPHIYCGERNSWGVDSMQSGSSVLFTETQVALMESRSK